MAKKKKSNPNRRKARVIEYLIRKFQAPRFVLGRVRAWFSLDVGLNRMGETKMIVGLGNPGTEYERTRHNIGFRAIDLVARVLSTGKFKRRKFGAAVGRAEFEDKKLILLKPLCFMNQSGQVVAGAVSFYKLPLADLLVVLDDMALEPGSIRIRARGSAGGHKGLADIIEKLQSSEFSRLRIGIGRDDSDQPRTDRDYVLDEPTPQELDPIEAALQKAQQAVLCWARSGTEAAMNEFNR